MLYSGTKATLSAEGFHEDLHAARGHPQYQWRTRSLLPPCCYPCTGKAQTLDHERHILAGARRRYCRPTVTQPLVIGLPLSRDAGHDEIWGPRDQNHGQPPSSPTQRCFDRRFFGTSAPRHYDVFTIVSFESRVPKSSSLQRILRSASQQRRFLHQISSSHRPQNAGQSPPDLPTLYCAFDCLLRNTLLRQLLQRLPRKHISNHVGHDRPFLRHRSRSSRCLHHRSFETPVYQGGLSCSGCGDRPCNSGC
jgi:hypothetical protein